MKTFLILSLLAVPLQAEVRGAARVGIFVGSNQDLTGTVEIEARYHGWSFAPAYESIQGGYGLHAIHADVRRLFTTAHNTFWIGAGPTFVSTNSGSDGSETTWNADAGFAWRLNRNWEPFVAARYYRFRIPVFRDEVKGSGAVISIGISRRFF